MTSCRFVDRDMVMHYHWGLVAGHTHACGMGTAPEPEILTTAISSSGDYPGLETSFVPTVDAHIEGENQNDDDPELGFENREDDFIEEGENTDGEDSLIEAAENFDGEQGIDVDDLLAMDDMYEPIYA